MVPNKWLKNSKVTNALKVVSKALCKGKEKRIYLHEATFRNAKNMIKPNMKVIH